MKKIYIPSEDELRQIESLTKSTAHTYKYILAKTIETLLMERNLDSNKNTLEVVYKYFREFPDIVYAICKMYPEDKYLCKEASDDKELCERLIKGISPQDSSIKQLDEILAYFEKGLLVIDSPNIINAIADALAKGLQTYPKYRYEYRENEQLDQIFSCEMPIYSMPIRPTPEFMTIDPIYALKISNFEPYVENSKNRMLKESIDLYAMRNGINAHGITGAGTKSIMENSKTKKLIRCLEYHKEKYQ